MEQYGEVFARFDTDGRIIPRAVKIGDEKFGVDRGREIRPAASLKSGGAGIRYTCSVEGRLTYLFLEETKWFLEPAC